MKILLWSLGMAITLPVIYVIGIFILVVGGVNDKDIESLVRVLRNNGD